MKRRLINIILLVSLILLSFIVASNLLNSESYKSFDRNLKDNINTGLNYKLLYESEPGFGNDKFKVYRFSLNRPRDIEGFIALDDISRKILEDDIKDFFIREDKNTDRVLDYKNIYQELNDLENSGQTRYLYKKIENDLSYEFYVYNKKMNIGYYVISIF